MALFALVAFLSVPSMPELASVLPVRATYLLALPALGVMSVIGWWRGGRGSTSVAWVLVTSLVVTEAVRGAPAESAGFVRAVAGWGLLVAAAFGLATLVDAARPFFARALIAVAAAGLVASALVAVSPLRPSGMVRLVESEMVRRNGAATAVLRRLYAVWTVESPDQWRDFAARSPEFADADRVEEHLNGATSRAVPIFPALLAIESVLALAVAWSLYHRLSRIRLGAALSPLPAFRFNDQLVWGMIVGVTFLVLHTLTAFRDVGKNFVVFFGALYVVRGLGVLAFLASPGLVSATLALSLSFLVLPVPALQPAAALALMLVIFVALGLGLGDTWFDWRGRTRSTP